MARGRESASVGSSEAAAKMMGTATWAHQWVPLLATSGTFHGHGQCVSLTAVSELKEVGSGPDPTGRPSTAVGDLDGSPWSGRFGDRCPGRAVGDRRRCEHPADPPGGVDAA